MEVLTASSLFVSKLDNSHIGFQSMKHYKHSTEVPEELGFEFEDGPQTLEYYFGGDVFVVENAKDLSEIFTLLPKGNRGHYTLAEQPAAFDFANWHGDYLHIGNCTNNNGGTVYVIPREIAEASFNVKASIAATRLFWG
jgi:hypothetical protein